MVSIKFGAMSEFVEKTFGDFGFELLTGTLYADIYVARDRKMIACVLLDEYVPIRYFKETFGLISAEIRKGGYETFIFDKRALRTFHQPSMEWYFLDWKTEMIQFGLTHHRKLLPDLPWFVKTVEIARNPLLSKLPEAVRQQLDIRYCSTLEEAVV